MLPVALLRYLDHQLPTRELTFDEKALIWQREFEPWISMDIIEYYIFKILKELYIIIYEHYLYALDNIPYHWEICVTVWTLSYTDFKKFKIETYLGNFMSSGTIVYSNFVKKNYYKSNFILNLFDKTNLICFLRYSRFFNKSKFSRNRQICINITLLGLCLNILFISELHRVFYQLTINYHYVGYIVLWIVTIIYLLNKNFFLK